MKSKILVFAGSAMLVSAVSVCAEDMPEAKALFEEKCSRCHSLKIPLSRNKDRAGWAETVKHMMARSPEWLTEREAEMIVDYLSTVRGKQ